MIFGISKTTVNGILALLITILSAILSYQIPTALLTPQASKTWLIVTAICTFVLGILRAIVGFMQNDAPPNPPSPGSPTGKIAAMLLICLLILPLTACNSVSTSTPTAPAVTALDVLNQVQGDVLAVQSAEIAAVNAGLIDQATNTAIQKALKQEAIDAAAVATAISSAATAATVQAKVDALLADLQNDVTNGALGIKDAKTRATVVASISVAEIAVNGIMAAYSAGK